MRTKEDILGSAFCRKATETSLVVRQGRPSAGNLVRDLLDETERMAEHCQLSEFTDHGIPHLASLVSRIQTWTLSDRSPLLDKLSNEEAFLLLFAVLTHDVGMLSQMEHDLEESERIAYAGAFSELPAWVRRTHVLRLKGIVRRLLDHYPEFMETAPFALGVSLARSHSSWPEGVGYQEVGASAASTGLNADRMKAVAGVLAVADLLDEDSGRCDTMILLANKAGNLMNRAHWLRHLLIDGPIQVEAGTVTIRIQVPANLDGKVNGAVQGLRNHLLLAEAYNVVLGSIGAELSVAFEPPKRATGAPEVAQLGLLLCEPETHLLRTLPDEALPPATRSEPEGSDVSVKGVTLKRVDRGVLDAALGPVGRHSARSDLEITYAAARIRGGDGLGHALGLLRTAAIEADARGEIDTVLRLCSLSLAEHEERETHALPEAYWAAAYTLHWARREYDLIAVDRLLDAGSERMAIPHAHRDEILAKLPLRWRILGMAVQVLLSHRTYRLEEVAELAKCRLQEGVLPMSPEEHLAWHDLIEALWGTGHFAQCGQSECTALIGHIQQLELMQTPVARRLLAELSWRMGVQSTCLRGYGRWEAATRSTERRDFGLPADSGREAMGRAWLSWFRADPDAGERAREARRDNPPGSELYLAGLQADWMASSNSVLTLARDDDAPFRSQEFREATDADDVHRLIDSVVTSMLDRSIAPKKEGEVFFGGREAQLLTHEAILGERVALRRWYLSSWHKVVGYNVRTTMSLAHTLYLEGDSVVLPVLDAIRNLPWGVPYVGKGKELIEALFPRIEPLLKASDLEPLFGAMARSPRRIGNTAHPALSVLSDALPEGMLTVLIDWTRQEIQHAADGRPRPRLEVWPELMENLPTEVWLQLTFLVDHVSEQMPSSPTKERIVETTIAEAPWSVAAPLVRRVAATLAKTDPGPDLIQFAKERGGGGLLRRRGSDWRRSPEAQELVQALSRVAASGADSADRVLLEFLSDLGPDAASAGVATHWLMRLHEVRDTAIARKDTRQVGFGSPGYYVGPSRSISDPIALDAATSLDELWAAENVLEEELEVGTDCAGHLFRASSGAGRDALVRSILSAMESRRSAVGLALDRTAAAPIAWRKAAIHSGHFDDDCLDQLQRILLGRLFDLPIEVTWAQARFATELLVRAGSSDATHLARSALLGIRGRCSGQPRWGVRAVVSILDRLAEQGGEGSSTASALEFVLPWIEEAGSAPVASGRRNIALLCSKIAREQASPLRERLAAVADKLRNDVRLSVRLAAGGVEDLQ